MISMEETSLKKAETEWIALQNGVMSLVPFQEFEFNRILSDQYLFLSKGLRPRFFLFKEAGRTICIAPMCEDLTAKGGVLMTLGARPELALQDWLYDESITAEKLKECIRLLQAKYSCLCFNRLSEKTALFSVINSMSAPIRTHKNVVIKAPDRYADWYGSLSKNMRQTIRSMYNRLDADKAEYELIIKKGNEISKKQYAELMSVLTQRRRKRYGYSRLLALYIKHIYFHTIALKKMKNTMFFIMRINDEVAAFHAGYVYKDGKTILLPYSAMNDRFAYYSPGDLLFCEVIKLLKSEYGIENYDTSKDDETYKLRLGGRVYLTYDYILREEKRCRI